MVHLLLKIPPLELKKFVVSSSIRYTPSFPTPSIVSIRPLLLSLAIC